MQKVADTAYVSLRQLPNKLSLERWQNGIFFDLQQPSKASLCGLWTLFSFHTKLLKEKM